MALRPQRVAGSKAGESALLALAHAYRAFAREHPGRYTAAVRAPDPPGAEWSVAYEEQMRILLVVRVGYDLDGGGALHATRDLHSIRQGFVTREAGEAVSGRSTAMRASPAWSVCSFLVWTPSADGQMGRRTRGRA